MAPPSPASVSMAQQLASIAWFLGSKRLHFECTDPAQAASDPLYQRVRFAASLCPGSSLSSNAAGRIADAEATRVPMDMEFSIDLRDQFHPTVGLTARFAVPLPSDALLALASSAGALFSMGTRGCGGMCVEVWHLGLPHNDVLERMMEICTRAVDERVSLLSTTCVFVSDAADQHRSAAN